MSKRTAGEKQRDEGRRIAENWQNEGAGKPLELSVLPFGVPCTGGAYGERYQCIHAGQAIDEAIGLCFIGRSETEGWIKPNSRALKGKHSSESEEHWTPPEIIIPGKTFLGGFDTDPASTSECNSLYVRASRIYTRTENGITKKWFGRCFVNPPSSIKSKEAAWQWWNKLAREFEEGNVSSAIYIVFNTNFFQVAQLHAKEEGLILPQWTSRCEPLRRIDYLKPNETQQGLPGVGISATRGGAPPHSSAILFLSDDAKLHAKFAEAYEHLGEVLPPAKIPTRIPRKSNHEPVQLVLL